MMNSPLSRDFTVTCEADGCGKQIEGLGNAHSFIIHYALTGTPGVAAQFCPAEQHYACSTEHARQVAHRCIDEHLIPSHQAATHQFLEAMQTQAQAITSALNNMNKDNQE